MRWLLILCILLGGCSVERMTHVKLVDTDSGSHAQNHATIMRHEGAGANVVFWYDYTTRDNKVAVLKDDLTLGTPVDIACDIYREPYQQWAYSAYSDKIYLLVDVGPNTVAAIIDVTGDTVSVDLDTLGSIPLGGPVITLEVGRLVICGYDEPRFYVFSINQSTGALTQLGTYEDNPMGIVDGENYGHIMAPLDGNRFLFCTSTDAGNPYHDQIATVCTAGATGLVTCGSNYSIKPNNTKVWYGQGHAVNDSTVMVIYENGTGDSILQTLDIVGTTVHVSADILYPRLNGMLWASNFHFVNVASNYVAILIADYNQDSWWMTLHNPYDLEPAADHIVNVLDYRGEFTPGYFYGLSFGGIVYDPDTDRLLTVALYHEDPSWESWEVWAFGTEDSKPLFWTNFRGQSETK